MRYVWIMFGVVATSALPAAASPVTWEFAGEITSVFDPDNFLGGDVTVGSPFSGSFTFESTTPDLGSVPWSGYYVDAVTQIGGHLDGLSFDGPTGISNNIRVRNDDPSEAFDHYSVSTGIILLGRELGFDLDLRDSTGMMFTSDALPLFPPLLQHTDALGANMRFHALTEEENFVLRGHVTGLVPEPATLVLMGLATLLIARRRRVDVC